MHFIFQTTTRSVFALKPCVHDLLKNCVKTGIEPFQSDQRNSCALLSVIQRQLVNRNKEFLTL